MRITVADWTRAAKLGTAVLAAFAITAARPVVTVSFDLLDDGLPGITVAAPAGGDLRGLRGLGIEAKREGTFRVQLGATDAAGCSDRTAEARRVEVTRP